MRLLLILALLWAEFWSIVAVSRPLGGLATFVLLLLMALPRLLSGAVSGHQFRWLLVMLLRQLQ